MSTLEQQRQIIERKIAMVNLLKSVNSFAQDRLKDPKGHNGVVDEVQRMVQFAIDGIVKRIENGTWEQTTKTVTTNMPLEKTEEPVKKPSEMVKDKGQKAEFAKQYAYLANKIFDLHTNAGTQKAKVVGLAAPNAIIFIEETNETLHIPIEMIE